MVLVDTSIWISHLRTGNAQLKKLLLAGEVLCHPLVIGELACGNLKNREQILSLLEALPHAIEVEHHEVLHLIEIHQLMGLGIGIVDVHLMASAILSRTPLWTTDKRLIEAAKKLEIHYR